MPIGHYAGFRQPFGGQRGHPGIEAVRREVQGFAQQAIEFGTGGRAEGAGYLSLESAASG